MLKIYVSAMTVVGALALPAASFAAADPALTTNATSLTTYFTDNLPTVIGAFIAVAMAIWILNLLFRSVGVKKPSKVG